MQDNLLLGMRWLEDDFAGYGRSKLYVRYFIDWESKHGVYAYGYMFVFSPSNRLCAQVLVINDFVNDNQLPRQLASKVTRIQFLGSMRVII